MTGMTGSRFAAGIVVLTMAVAACGYDNASGPGYGDSTAVASLKAQPRVIAASGNLTAALAEFRHRLGDSSNKTAGEKASGRREINWDGVAGTLLNVDTFPGDQFNRVVPRGQIFSTDGTGFRVSDNALADLNPTYASEFAAFSPTKIFTAVGSRALTVNFVVAGSLTPARVNGFGVVFTDVDVAQATTLAFFDAQGRLLQKVSAPVRSDAAGFSFVGVTFTNAIVARVRIVSGQARITGLESDVSAGGGADLVAMDDFISGEPHPIQ
jgi:hypothetical protein